MSVEFIVTMWKILAVIAVAGAFLTGIACVLLEVAKYLRDYDKQEKG